MSKTHQEHGNRGFIEDQRAFFDKLITQDWDTYQNPQWDKSRQLEVGEVLRRITPPRRVLDVGCGVGYHDLVFAGVPSVEQVVGIDYSEKSIEQANAHYPHPKVKREVANIFDTEAIIQRWGQFDLVASFEVFEHLTDAAGFLRACRDCVAPGGYVAVITPNRLRFTNRWRRLLGLDFKMQDPMHFAEYIPGEVIQMGAALGLRSIGTFGYALNLAFSRRLVLVRGTSGFGLRLGQILPSWAVVMGIVFQRPNEHG